jgi:DNA-binding transcriptional MerR regulator
MEINRFLQSISKSDYNTVPEKLLEKVFQKEYTLKSLDISARTLQSWYDSKLLPYDILNEKRHRFNFVELFWLNMIIDLRKFGLPLNTIRIVKSQLLREFSLDEFIKELSFDEAINILEIFNLWEEDKKEVFHKWFKELKNNKEVIPFNELLESDFPPLTDLFLILVQIMLAEEKFFITISDLGQVEEFKKDEASQLLVYLGYKAKIVMPLSSFFYQYVEDIKNLDFLQGMGILNRFEIDLIKVIHRGEFDKVTVKFKDKKAEMLEFTKQVKQADLGKINNIVARKKYQEIIIKTESGDIRYANVTQKVKLSDDKK